MPSRETPRGASLAGAGPTGDHGAADQPAHVARSSNVSSLDAGSLNVSGRSAVSLKVRDLWASAGRWTYGVAIHNIRSVESS